LIFLKFAYERLTAKQKLILKRLPAEKATSSSLAAALSKELGCSRSCIFNNLNQLRRCGLVDGENGSPLRLTDAGRLVSEKMGVGANENKS